MQAEEELETKLMAALDQGDFQEVTPEFFKHLLHVRFINKFNDKFNSENYARWIINKNIAITKLAEMDLLELIDTYPIDNAGDAFRFVWIVKIAIERGAEAYAKCECPRKAANIGTPIAKWSERCAANSRIYAIRMWKISNFSSLQIFYQLTENNIRILRILHGARYWPEWFDGMY